MLDASTLHDALRSEGLVPPEEDVHLLACSNRWHGALHRVYDGLGLGDIADAKAMLDESQGEVASLEDLLEEARKETRAADKELVIAEKSRDDAMREAERHLSCIVQLEKALEVAEE